jgi:hypothetical protein
MCCGFCLCAIVSYSIYAIHSLNAADCDFECLQVGSFSFIMLLLFARQIGINLKPFGIRFSGAASVFDGATQLQLNILMAKKPTGGFAFAVDFNIQAG